MRWMVLVLATAPLCGPERQPGRFALVTAQGRTLNNEFRPYSILLDTASADAWYLCTDAHEIPKWCMINTAAGLSRLAAYKDEP